MNDQKPFGAGVVLAGWLHDPDLNFRFEVWAASAPVSDSYVDQTFLAWRRESRKNVPKRNGLVRVKVNLVRDIRR